MKSSHATAAAQIRAELKSAFPGIKFYVKSASFSGGDSVRIEWENGPTSKQVNAIVDKYQYGSFNSMEDIYEYDNKNTEVEQVKYVQVQREISQDIKDGIRAEYNFAESVAESVIGETIRREAGKRCYNANGGWYYIHVPSEEVSPEPVAETVSGGIDEVLDVIFTHEKGQNQMTIPLEMLLRAGFFEDKEKFEFGLLSFFKAATSFRAVGVTCAFGVETPKLAKISTCIYTNSDFLPDWYGDWNGKFYYDI